MNINENEFFREAALRICGNLEIHNALDSLFKYLSTFMPLNSIYLEIYEEKLSSMRIIAKATKDKGESTNQKQTHEHHHFFSQ